MTLTPNERRNEALYSGIVTFGRSATKRSVFENTHAFVIVRVKELHLWALFVLGEMKEVVLLRPDVQTKGASVNGTDHLKPFRVTPEDLERFFLDDAFFSDVKISVTF